MATNEKVSQQRLPQKAHPASYRVPNYAPWTTIWDNRDTAPASACRRPLTAAAIDAHVATRVPLPHPRTTAPARRGMSPRQFETIVRPLRRFFTSRGFLEVNTQGRASILSAWESPGRLQTYMSAGALWPLPQSGAAWLELELAKEPNAAGFFCLTNSYGGMSAETVPRPIFEFAFRGKQEDLRKLVVALTGELDDAGLLRCGDTPWRVEENTLVAENHFWNVAVDGEIGGEQRARNTDIYVGNKRIIHAAERSQNKKEMEFAFIVSQDGRHSTDLFGRFGRARTATEFSEYVNTCSFPRCTGVVDMAGLCEHS